MISYYLGIANSRTASNPKIGLRQGLTHKFYLESPCNMWFRVPHIKIWDNLLNQFQNIMDKLLTLLNRKGLLRNHQCQCSSMAWPSSSVNPATLSYLPSWLTTTTSPLYAAIPESECIHITLLELSTAELKIMSISFSSRQIINQRAP
jgi:hypothetical protein